MAGSKINEPQSKSQESMQSMQRINAPSTKRAEWTIGSRERNRKRDKGKERRRQLKAKSKDGLLYFFFFLSPLLPVPLLFTLGTKKCQALSYCGE